MIMIKIVDIIIDTSDTVNLSFISHSLKSTDMSIKEANMYVNTNDAINISAYFIF